MKVHELITELQNFDMNADVEALVEVHYWDYSPEEGSYEVCEPRWTGNFTLQFDYSDNTIKIVEN